MATWQIDRRHVLSGLLGDLPDRSRPIGAHLVGTETQDTVVLEKLLLDLNGIEPVPAYFVRPREVAGPLPMTPPAGLDRIDAALRKVYAESGAPEAWKLARYDIGHFETAAM